MTTPTSANYLPQVKEQYEEFPYPHRIPEDEKSRFIVSWLARFDAVSHHCFGGRQTFKNFRVLVAGGGTGDSLISWAEQLRGIEGSSVVYLDLSEKSASIAKKRADIRKLDNITWINDSILNIPHLGLGAFDFIDCTGVLHHLADPDAGLKALAGVLKPDGAMNLMVYGLYGRTGIYQVQDAMRLVNTGEDNPRRKIENTRTVLKSLPGHHFLNISKQIGWTYSDIDNDAGIFDLFLHSQDRAYTIVQIHDWLERCGLTLASEPGARYTQLHYLPETFIKDRDLLDKISGYPLKIRQGIAEAISTKITMHEFYVVPHARGAETQATVGDTSLVPYAGMTSFVPFSKLAEIADKHNDEFTLTLDEIPGKPVMSVPKGRCISSLLRAIDGQRTVGQVLAIAKSDPKLAGKPPEDEELMREFERLFISLNRGHALYLRGADIPPYATIKEIEARMKSI